MRPNFGPAQARRFFRRALATLNVTSTEVVTDAAPVYPRVLDELIPAAWHHVEPYERNRIEADDGRLTRKSVREWAGGSARRSAAEPGIRFGSGQAAAGSSGRG
jgi:transposase-like protein